MFFLGVGENPLNGFLVPLSESVTFLATVRYFSFFLQSNFFLDVLSLRFFGGAGGSTASSRGFFC